MKDGARGRGWSLEVSVLVGSDTRVIIQGLGKTGRFHTKQRASTTERRWLGRSTSRAGEVEREEVEGRPETGYELPIFHYTSPRRSAETSANASVIYVPPPFAADAIMEAADAVLAHRRHHRGHPGHRHGARRRTSGSHGAPGRPNCPG